MLIDHFGTTQMDAADYFARQNQNTGEKQEESDKLVTLGATTHTQEEWERLLGRVDRYLECVKKEQKQQVQAARQEAETKKIYAKLSQKAKEQKKRLLKETEEHNVTNRLLEQKERYMATPQEWAEGEYEITDKETGETYKFKETDSFQEKSK